MAFELGDPSTKLPPIRRRGSVTTTSSRGIDLASSAPCLNRQKHGLVRLPPIDRHNSPQSNTRPSSGDDGSWRIEDHSPYPLYSDTLHDDHRKSQGTTDLPQARFSSRFSPTVRDGDTGDKYEEQQLRPNVNYTCGTTDVGKHGTRPAEEIAKSCSFRRPSLSTVQDALSSSTTHKFCEKPNVLRRGRSLAKSSPELSERKHCTQNPKTTVDNSDSSARRPSVFNINATLLLQCEENTVGGQAPSSRKPSKQKVPKVEGTARQRTKRINKDVALTKTYSNPASPVCDQRTSQSSKAHGRKSLTGIERFELPVNNRRPSLQPVKSQNLMKHDHTGGLTVKGKTCPWSERRPSRTSSINHHLVPPSNTPAKRDSLYDLRQILGILNQEGADPPSAAASPHNAGPSPADGSGNMASSVYDLREFLSLALADAFREDAEERSEKGLEKSLQTQPPAEGTSSSPLNADTASRRASAYDLMEFLTLDLSAVKPSEQSSSRTSSPRAVSLPAGQQDSRPANLEVPGNDSSRRSSVYDLVEFLSLRASSRPHTPFQEKQKSSQSPSLEAKRSQEPLQESRKERSLSVYDLQEFLAMQTATVEPAANQENRNTNSMHQSGEKLTVPGAQNVKDETNKETVMKGPTLTGTSVVEGQVIEGQRHENRQVSVYDLRDFLKLYSFSRKPSNISQSGVAIYVTDEKPEGEEDTSLLIPQQLEAAQRKPSTYDLSEFLSALENDDSPLRRRMSSISGASADYHEHRPSISARTDSGGSSFLCVNSGSARTSFSDASRSRLLPRQESIGNRSLYDLHEFLTLLNSEDALSGRCSSNMSERGPTSPSRQDAEKFVYDLQDHQKKETSSDLAKTESQRAVEEDASEMSKEDISIEVPKFLPKAAEKTISDRFSIKNRLASLKSVPETTDN